MIKKHSIIRIREIDLNTKRGFTLLEMLVSLGIFSIVALIAVGSLVRITGLNRQAQALQSSMNNIAYALESISRDMRMGGQYTCTDSLLGINWVNGGGTSLNKTPCPVTVVASVNKYIVYESSEHYKNGVNECNLIYAFGFFKVSGSNPATWLLKKAQQNSCGETITDSDFSPVIDEVNTTISNYQLGVNSGTGGYSRAFIRLTGYAGERDREKSYFDVQTGVSQRLPSSN